MRSVVFDGTNLDKILSEEDLKNPFEGHTPFAEVYECFLSKITDDMYMELTPQDTLRDLQRLLLNAIPGFEFPRVVIDDFVINIEEKHESVVTEADFVIGPSSPMEDTGFVLVESSYFQNELTKEELNILAILMMEGWVQRQITSIEVTRMKYSGPDFKMTSQANHLAKLINLLHETQRQSIHMQRLYKRRKRDAATGKISSNWSTLREVSVIDD